MDVILDTNIYRQDLAARSARFDVLLDYLEKTNSRLLMPTLVRDELAGVLALEVKERQLRIANAARDIERLLPHRTDPLRPIELDAEHEVANYLKYL